MKVKNMTSVNGNTVPNQFIITDDLGNEFFQSYETIIAKRCAESGDIILDSDSWDYSRTTAKYRNMFTGMDTSETKESIKSGEIKLANLNN